MFVLVYAPHGIVGEDGSRVLVTDTLEGAKWEMERQVDEYLKDNGLEACDKSLDDHHATADLSEAEAPEWHIYECSYC